MARKTKIEWAATQLPDGTLKPGATWNMIAGCTKKSAGCRECYALRDSWRIMHNPKRPTRYDGVAEKVGDQVRWTSRVNLDYDALEEPLRWRKPQMIFVASMSDLFHAKVPFEFIDEVFNVMAQARWHTFQVLTKRPERMLEWMRYQQSETGEGYLNEGNVWIGVTAEDQTTADERIPFLVKVDGPVRFVSVEPMLEPIDLSLFRPLSWHPEFKFKALDWLICGGESGTNARPMHPDWARDIRDQCKRAGVPFFFKQMSKKEPIPDDLMIREFPEA